MANQIPESFAQLWRDFWRNCMEGRVDPAMKPIIKDVFYAGAQSYLNLMRRAFELGMREADFRAFHMMIEDEVWAHFEQVELATVH